MGVHEEPILKNQIVLFAFVCWKNHFLPQIQVEFQCFGLPQDSPLPQGKKDLMRMSCPPTTSEYSRPSTSMAHHS